MKRVCIFLIKFYQKSISPIFGKSCRFTPSCSQYTIEAIDEYGALKGIFMGIKRIIRCNPFSEGGYDPVPKKNNKEEW